MLRWSVPALLLLVALAALLVFGGERADPMAANADGSVTGLTDILARTDAAQRNRLCFEEVAARSGIRWKHFPATRQSLLPEDMGSGLAWGDYDNDGDADLFAVNFSGNIGAESSAAMSATADGRCALFRNEGNGSFTDVSVTAGAAVRLFGMGAAWGDYDNDGWLDIFVSGYGPDVLLHNRRDGSFSEVSERAGVSDALFSSGCAWGDYDNDGWLDLYVCNYVRFTLSADDRQQSTLQYGSEIPFTLNPSSYEPAPNKLYRNRRDGTFEEVARATGTDNPTGRSLQCVWMDFNNDGLLDLYVANDVSSNGVYQNRGDGTFADIGASSLAADYRGAMGLGVGDHNQDGFLDIFITHWVAQENALYENQTGNTLGGDGGQAQVVFMEVGELLGLGYPSLHVVGWATGFADFDNDGCLDLWAANGHTLEERDNRTKLRAQALQIFQCDPGSGFFEVAQAAWRGGKPVVARGGALADYDADGCMDIAFLIHGGRVQLLRNATPQNGHWLQVRLRQREKNIHAIGARVECHSHSTPSGPVGPADGVVIQTAMVQAGGSYLSQDYSDLHFGLGRAARVEKIVIHWPDGNSETITAPALDRRHTFGHIPHYR